MGKLLSIVLTDNHIRIAELSNGRRGVSVYRLLTKEVPESLVSGGLIVDVRGFAEYLNATLKYANIKTKKVVFSLPSDRIMSREVVLPEMKEEKLKTALKVNAPEYFPVELTDYVLSYFTISRILEDETENGDEDEETQERKKAKRKKPGIGRSRSKLRLMVVAVPNEMVQSYYDAAKLAHLKLISVDYIGNSVFQLTSNQIGDEPCLVIQLDEEHTVLTIYNETVMVLQRHVDFGSISLLQSIMDKKNCSQEEALEQLERRQLIHDNFDDGDELTDTLYYLVSNIKRVIEYYTGRNADHPLELVYIIGDGSRISGLDELFDKQLNLPVERITALKQVSVKESAGLSMKEVLRYMDNIGAVVDPVDLIPKQLEQDIRRKLEAKAYRVMILLALAISSMLNNKKLKCRGLFRTAIFLPCVTSLVAYSIIFKSLFANDGFINGMLMNLHMIAEPINWLTNPTFARILIIIAITWRWTGYNMIFYLSGLQSIDDSIYEAAAIDGATGFQKFRYMTLPLLKPIILFTTINSTIGTLQLFDETMNITQGGPANTTITISQYIYNLLFKYQPNFGYAAADSSDAGRIRQYTTVKLPQFILTNEKRKL